MTQAEEFVANFEQGVDEHPDELAPELSVLVPDTEEIVDEKRWANVKVVVYRLPDDSYVRFQWEDPATEMQEGQELNTQAEVVWPYEVTKTEYFNVKPKH